jgi:hypothetical protein
MMQMPTTRSIESMNVIGGSAAQTMVERDKTNDQPQPRKDDDE